MSTANSGAPSVDHLADPVFAVDNGGVLHYANDTAADVLGWDATELLGTTVLDLIHPDDLSLATSALQTVQEKAFGDLLTLRVRTGRGTWRYLEFRGTYREPDLPDPLAGLIVIVARDVTDRHRLEFDQGDTEVLRAVMANMHGMVVLADSHGLVRSVNGAVTRLLGHDPETVRGRSILDYLHHDDRDSIVDAVQRLDPQGSLTLDARILTADGTPLICEFTVNNLLDDPVVASFVISAQIATSLADARDRVEFLAEHDSRTGLLNRDGFMRAARTMMRAGTGLGILIVDIVHFRSINELYGEPVGDAVLSAVAERIDQIRWPDLITARFGGDEFVLAIRASSPSAVEMLRERVRRDVARPIAVDAQEVNFDIRTAMAFEARPEVLDALLVSASNELMSAKRFADPEAGGISVDAINERRRQLELLRAALEDGQIQPYFQPICTADGTITSSRWRGWPDSPKRSTTRCSTEPWSSQWASHTQAIPRSRCTSTSTRRRSHGPPSGPRFSSGAVGPAPTRRNWSWRSPKPTCSRRARPRWPTCRSSASQAFTCRSTTSGRATRVSPTCWNSRSTASRSTVASSPGSMSIRRQPTSPPRSSA